MNYRITALMKIFKLVFTCSGLQERLLRIIATGLKRWLSPEGFWNRFSRLGTISAGGVYLSVCEVMFTITWQPDRESCSSESATQSHSLSISEVLVATESVVAASLVRPGNKQVGDIYDAKA